MVQALGSISYSILAEIISILSKKNWKIFLEADKAIHVFHLRYNFHKILWKIVQILSSWPGSECKTVPLTEFRVNRKLSGHICYYPLERIYRYGKYFSTGLSENNTKADIIPHKLVFKSRSLSKLAQLVPTLQ